MYLCFCCCRVDMPPSCIAELPEDLCPSAVDVLDTNSSTFRHRIYVRLTGTNHIPMTTRCYARRVGHAARSSNNHRWLLWLSLHEKWTNCPYPSLTVSGERTKTRATTEEYTFWLHPRVSWAGCKFYNTLIMAYHTTVWVFDILIDYLLRAVIAQW